MTIAEIVDQLADELKKQRCPAEFELRLPWHTFRRYKSDLNHGDDPMDSPIQVRGGGRNFLVALLEPEEESK